MWFFCVETGSTPPSDPNNPGHPPPGYVDTSFDSSYFKTLPGGLKIAEMALSLLGFICIETSIFTYHPRGKFFVFVSTTGFWFTGFLLVLYLFHNIEKCHKVPWLKIELIYCALWSLFYLITSCLAVTFGIEAFSAAAFFGFGAMIVYGIDAYLKWTYIRNGLPPQPPRVVAVSKPETAPPPYPGY